MKKVLAILAVVGFASFGFADEPVDIGTNMASFEGLTLNEDDGEGTQVPASGGLLNEAGELDTTADDAGQSDGQFFWYLPGTRFDAELIVTPYETNADGVISYNYDAHGFDGSLFSGVQSNYLSICTVDQPLSRSVLPRMAQTTTAADIGNGIYIDTLIQFQPSEVAPTADMENDKLLVWMQEVEADEDADIEAATNLVVTAGYLENSLNIILPTNYVVTVADTTVNPGEWHRLTVKSIKDIGATATGVAGFVVFIDGKVATSTESRGVAESVIGGLSPAAADWAEQNALFPSLMDISFTDKRGKLAAVSFDGTGAIDDLSIARSAPFPGANDKTRLRIEITEGVIGVTVRWGDREDQKKTLELADFEEDKATVVMQELGAVVATVTATYDSENGWKKDKDGWEVVGGSCEATTPDSVYTIALGTMGEIKVKAFCPKFVVNDGEENEEEFDTFASALAKFAGASEATAGTIKLISNIYTTLTIGEGQYVILDLNGKTIQGPATAETSIDNSNGGWLKIIDTSKKASGKVIAPDNIDADAVNTSGGAGTIIEAGIYNGSIYTSKTPTLELYGGSFNDTSVLTCIAEGYKSEDDPENEGYKRVIVDNVKDITWVLGDGAAWAAGAAPFNSYAPGTAKALPTADAVTAPTDKKLVGWYIGEVETLVTEIPTTATEDLTITAVYADVYTITTTGAANADVVLNPVDGKVLLNETVAIVATPKENFTYEGVALGADWTLIEGSISNLVTVTASAQITVPDAVPAVTTATLTLETLPEGVTEAKVYQKAEGVTDWAEVTIDAGAYAITAGNYYQVAVTADTGYDLVTGGKITSNAPVEAGETIAITTEHLTALITIHNYTITYMNDTAEITTLEPATFTITNAIALPTPLGQLGGELEGWYTNSALTAGTEITGWAAGEMTENVTVYAKIKQVVDEPAEIIKDKVDTTGLDNSQAAAAKANAAIIYAAKGSKEAAEAWITKVYGESAKIDGATLAAASAENVNIAMKYDIEIMVNPVIEFNATVAATEGNVAAFTFQIKDGTEGEAVSLAVAKVLEMVQYCSTLGSWGAATSENVAVSVDGATAKVQLKQTSATAGFMKVVLTPPAK